MKTDVPRGREAGGTFAFKSRARIAVVGGAVGCALVVAAILNTWSFGPLQTDLNPGSSMPMVSGTDSAGTSTTEGVGESQAVADGGQNSEPTGTGGDPKDDATLTEPEPSEITFTDSNFLVLKSDPDKFANSTAMISGKIYEIVDQSTGGRVLMTFRIHNQAIDSDESRAVIMFQEASLARTVPPQVGIDDCIFVEGVVRGGIGDRNALGQPIRIPIIDSRSLQEIECIDSAMTASVTIDSSLTQSYRGIALFAERVQLSDGHLRVKITAQNFGGTDTVFIRESESQAEYLDKTYRNLNHLPVFGAYGLDSSLPPKAEISGYLFFEPVEEFSGGSIVFKIIVERVGISENEKSTFILKL